MLWRFGNWSINNTKNKGIMTLHEAITEVLTTFGKAMTTQEIANELNRTGTYQKRNGSKIGAFQIHGRTRNYSHLFDRDKSLVSLKGEMDMSNKSTKPTIKTNKDKSIENTNYDIANLDKTLTDESKFRLANDIDPLVPAKPGLYCIRIKNINALPEPFYTELENREHNIIYIGIASQSLNKRMLNQELRANGHGTFFRSLGAILGFRPPFNSLAGKKNKRNYKFSSSDENKIIDWINKNLMVNWIEQSSGWEELEIALILNYKPLLNIANNPEAMLELSQLRKECVDVANGKKGK